MKKAFHENEYEKKARVAILITDKIDFKTKTNKRQRRILHNDKGINPTKKITVVNIYTPNIGAPKYIKQILIDIKREKNKQKMRIV